MKFPTPLIKAKLVKRYKRFLADVELEDGKIITVHCPNPGSMIGVKSPGSIVWISDSNNPKRKLRFTLELIEAQVEDGEPTLVGINTNQANKISEEAIISGKFPQLGPYKELRREVKYGKNSRIDFLLSHQNTQSIYVEVKSVTLQRQARLQEFPDGVTERGRKHLDELANMVNSGHRAIMLYLVQRSDGDKFSFARDIDPGYFESFDRAMKIGVEAIAIGCKVTPEEIIAERIIEIDEAGMNLAK